MVSPLVLSAGIGAGGQLLSGLLANSAANTAANYNYAANQANIAAGERADLRGRMAASAQRGRDELGVTDAQGNRVQFIPGRGWVTSLGDTSQQISDLSQAGQVYNLTEGERQRRASLERGAQGQVGEGQAATALMDQFINRARTDPTALANQIYSASEIGRQEGQDRIADATARQLVRQGNTSNVDDILASRAREGSRASEEARRQAAVQAPDIAAQRDAADASDTANLYNLFQQRATNPAGTPFAPQQVAGPQRPQTGVADAAMINLAARRPVQYDYIQPNMAGANAVASGANAAAGGINAYFQQQALDRYLNELSGTNRLLGDRGLGSTT